MTVQTIQATLAGYIQSSHADYATARAGGGTLTVSTSTQDLRVGQSGAAGPSYSVFVMFMIFDLTGIDPAEKVVLAIPQMYGGPDNDDLHNWDAQMVLHDFGDTLEAADWVPIDTLKTKPLLATFPASSHTVATWLNFVPTADFPGLIPADRKLRVAVLSSRSADSLPPDISGTPRERMFFQELADVNKPQIEVTSSFMVKNAVEIWRDFVPPEVHEPIKGEIRSWGTELERYAKQFVTFYGADPTGTMRSDGAFIAAQAYATSLGGGTVIVPPGTYILGDRVTAETAVMPTSHTHWLGLGRPKLINRSISALGKANVFHIVGVEDVEIKGFMIDGEQSLRNGILISGIVSNIKITDVNCHDHLTYGLIYGDVELDSDLAHYFGITVDGYEATGICGGGDSIGSGINFFPRASLPDGNPASQGATFRNIMLDLRNTHGEFLVASKNTAVWVTGTTYAVGTRVKSTDGLRVYVAIYGTGTSTVEPTGTAAVIVAGTYKWMYLGPIGGVVGAYLKQPAEWVASTSYPTVGVQALTPQSRIYEVITAGTSSASSPPGSIAGQETNADITDGTVHWKYIGVHRNTITAIPYNKGRKYSAGTQCKVIAHRNLATDVKATFNTTIVAGEITSVTVANPGTGYEKNVQIFFDDPLFTGRDATFGDPRNTFDHGTVGIKASNADSVTLDNILIFGGLAFPINLTSGGRNYVGTKIRVRESSFGFTITGNPQIVNRKWVVCATDVDVTNNTLQCRDLPTGGVVNHGYVNGQRVGFRATGDAIYETEEFPPPLSVDDVLYVVNATATTFKLSRILGGAAIDIVGKGNGYFQVGRATGLQTAKMTLRDFRHTRDGILNSSGVSCRIGGNLEDVTLDNIEIDGSFVIEPHRASDLVIGLKIPAMTIHDGNFTVEHLHPLETYKSGGVVGAHIGILNLYGDPAGVKATGRVILDPENLSGSSYQCPFIGCVFEEINMNGFQDHGILFSGKDCIFKRVTARGGNLLGSTTAAIVIDRGLRNRWEDIVSLVPARNIAAFVNGATYALNDMVYTFTGTPKRKRFYKVIVPGIAGSTPPDTDGDYTSNQVNFQFLWSQTNTIFYWNDKGGISLPVLGAFTGECIDIADGVQDKTTQLLRLENFSGDASGGASCPVGLYNINQPWQDPISLATATGRYPFEAVEALVILGWSIWVVTSVTTGASVSMGEYTAAGPGGTPAAVWTPSRYGSFTVAATKPIGYMHYFVNTTGGSESFNTRLLQRNSLLTMSVGGSGVGAVKMRAYAIPKR